MLKKEQRKELAIAHIRYTEENLNENTKRSVDNGIVYKGNMKFEFSNGQIPQMSVVDDTSEKAALKVEGTCCVLNFASFTRPGGGFVNGSMAQEEALCHASNLYDILKEYGKEYEDNYKFHRNHNLYKNWAIFSPNVAFLDGAGNIREINVLTCAAPNNSAIPYFISDETYYSALRSRIKFILDVCEENKQETLILGAFGCGVFKNDPRVVAEMFKEELESKRYNFKEVIFAVPDNGRNYNFKEFKEVYG